MKQTVTMIGLGYIGLPTALLLANAGVSVRGYDIDKRKINSLKENSLFFEENGLEAVFKSVQRKETFTPTSILEHSDVYIIAVPTPAKKGSAELRHVLSALRSIKAVFKSGDLIIVESTIAPRDCVNVLIPEIEKWNKSFLFAHCPERAIPGNTLYEMVHNDRIVGGKDQESNKKTIELYSKFVTGKLFTTNPTTAAACKVMENTYRAVNIALSNEFANIAKKLDFNVWEAIELSNKHPRVNIHQPGPGVGGHCIPIDPWFFIDPTTKFQTLIEKSLQINENMANIVTKEVITLAKKHNLKKPTIGLLGYAYKKNVDDTRETPTKKICVLFSKKFNVLLTDPYIKNEDFKTLKEVLSTASIIVLSTDHDTYKKIDFSKYPNIVFVYDTRNVFSQSNFKKSTAKLYKLGIRN